MTSAPMPVPERAVMPDLLRAFALLGIAVVNVVGFAQPLSSGFYEGGLETPSDRLAFGGMASIFLMKAYPLFAMMFGAGLAWQLAAAARSGADAGPRYFRRMAGLILIGVLHFVFFWYGDILIVYGLLGCLFFTMRGCRVKTLIGTGAALIAVNTIILLLFAALVSLSETQAPEALAEARSTSSDAQLNVFTTGSFLETAEWRWRQLPVVLPSVLLQQGIAVFGFFCFGLAAVKSGVIDKPDANIWRLSRWVFLPVGLAGSLWGAICILRAETLLSGQFMLGSAILMAFSAFSTLGYAGIIALFSKGNTGPIKRFVALAGSASLTAYLLQSLMLSFLFSGYGAGLFAQFSASQAILCGAAAGFASLVFTGVWRLFAERGPVEVALRRLTYWGRA